MGFEAGSVDFDDRLDCRERGNAGSAAGRSAPAARGARDRRGGCDPASRGAEQSLPGVVADGVDRGARPSGPARRSANSAPRRLPSHPSGRFRRGRESPAQSAHDSSDTESIYSKCCYAGVGNSGVETLPGSEEHVMEHSYSTSWHGIGRSARSVCAGWPDSSAGSAAERAATQASVEETVKQAA